MCKKFLFIIFFKKWLFYTKSSVKCFFEINKNNSIILIVYRYLVTLEKDKSVLKLSGQESYDNNCFV